MSEDSFDLLRSPWQCPCGEVKPRDKAPKRWEWRTDGWVHWCPTMSGFQAQYDGPREAMPAVSAKDAIQLLKDAAGTSEDRDE